MANPIGLNTIVEVKFFAQLQNQVSVNVRHYRSQSIGGDPAATDEQFATMLDVKFSPLYKQAMSQSATYLGLSVQILTPQLRPAVINNTGRGTGAKVGEPAVSQAAGLIKLTTNSAGRSGRGRVYIPFFAEGDTLLTGAFSAGYVLDLAQLGNAFDDVVVLGLLPNQLELDPVILKRADMSTKRITGYLPRLYPATQRRRSQINKGDAAPF